MSVLVGSTPANWAEAQLADICDLIPGAPTRDDPNGSVPVLKPKNLVSGKLTGPTDKMDAAEAEQHPRYRVRNGDLLCARTGTVGRVGLAKNNQAGWIFGSGLICIRINPSAPVDPQFLSFYFAHPAVSDWVTRHARGTSIPNISSRVLGALPVSLPPLSVQRAICHALVTLNDSIEAHQRICETAAELRDALLPLLLSGELPVSYRG
jgi:restriction endonuclease S subunit